MAFEPYEFPINSPSLLQDVSGARWVPLYRNTCTFGSEAFIKVIMNLIHNPNINSNWLFRADILFDKDANTGLSIATQSPQPIPVSFVDFVLDRIIVRKLIPRSTLRDKPLDQTCLVYHGGRTEEVSKSMVVYKPHVSGPTDMPFYHPKIQGLAFLYERNREKEEGFISIHYHFFDNDAPSPKLVRTGSRLLSTVYKHGQGLKAGYVKRIHHDTIIPQATVQNTYTRLKEKHARRLIKEWAETTDPTKHVFEDLGIAAFLIELWAQMYANSPFPGFVDIGCGNGLLVYVLREEGYPGWGFDARERKSWKTYSTSTKPTSGISTPDSLRQLVLLPSIIPDRKINLELDGLTHDGLFPKGTFIISNHADELTPWTPIIATVSECPFIMIPCCSHDLSGSKFRAPPPKQKNKSASAYSSLVEWVTSIATDCGWEVETEMLRIPSTRNTGLIGRRRFQTETDTPSILEKYGGTDAYVENVLKLVKSAPKSH